MKTQVHHIVTRSGHPIIVRPLRLTDTRHLVTLYERMSLQSRNQRFRSTVGTVPHPRLWQAAHDITHTTLPYGFGLLAFSDLPNEPHTPIAVIRYRLSPPDEAEISISVRDELQGQGVGSQLVLLIRDYARKHGIRRIFGLMPSDSRFLDSLSRQSLPGIKVIPQGKSTYISIPA